MPHSLDSESQTSEDHLAQEEGDENLLEPWVDWIRRTTHYVEEQLESTNIKDWVSQARVRKWRWCAKVLRSTDDRWTYSALKWDPACEKKSGRSQGRPATRWEDDIQKFIQAYYGAEHLSLEAWSSTALDAPTWQLLEKDYTTHVL